MKTFFKEMRLVLLSAKYSIMREMLNKVTFITNVLFMILNNATFILEWIILFSLKDNIGGYTIKEVLLLWGFAAGTYGICHVFFGQAPHLADLIMNGELDTFMVQPKDVLLSAITSKCDISAIGDILYAYIILLIYGFTIPRFFLYTFLMICGGLIFTAIHILVNALSF